MDYSTSRHGTQQRREEISIMLICFWKVGLISIGFGIVGVSSDDNIWDFD
jgi:hypothetical protein